MKILHERNELNSCCTKIPTKAQYILIFYTKNDFILSEETSDYELKAALCLTKCVA